MNGHPLKGVKNLRFGEINSAYNESMQTTSDQSAYWSSWSLSGVSGCIVGLAYNLMKVLEPTKLLLLPLITLMTYVPGDRSLTLCCQVGCVVEAVLTTEPVMFTMVML